MMKQANVSDAPLAVVSTLTSHIRVASLHHRPQHQGQLVALAINLLTLLHFLQPFACVGRGLFRATQITATCVGRDQRRAIRKAVAPAFNVCM